MAERILGDKSSHFIPCLDGIRAVAIWLVIFLHLCERLRWPQPDSRMAALLVGKGVSPIWGDGVGLFFVLSGFLITTLLVREYEKTGSMSLSAFYIRRCFRILPPLYVYLGVIFIFCIFEKIPFNSQHFLSSVLFYRDYYFGQELWITQHTWSLGVEEQFYLLWPALLLWTLHRWGKSAAAKVALFLILLTPLLRVGGKIADIALFSHHFGAMFHCRMDSLMAGCFVALASGTPWFERIYARVARYWWVFVIDFFFVSRFFDIRVGVGYTLSLGLTLDALCAAMFVLWATRNANSLVGRFLNAPLMRTMGVLSYSAYLWQTFFIHANNPTVLNAMPFNLLAIWLAAWLSYKFIERPALRMRDRLLSKQPLIQVEPQEQRT